MNPLILQGSKVAAAEITTVVTTKVPDDHILTCYSVMAMDETTEITTLIEIGIADGEGRTPIDSTPGPFPAATSMTIYWPFVLGPGQAVYAKFATPTASDVLRVVANGICERCYRDEESHPRR
jgi:hypothetical protein